MFLFIRKQHITLNLRNCFILGTFFVLALSPLLAYNLSTFDTLLESNSSQYMIWFMKYQTPEWRSQMIEMELSGRGGLFETIMLEPQLFFKNYLYNLFFHNSSHLFNFGTFSNMSIISLIPYVGLVPVLGGLLYILKIKRTDLVILSITFTLMLIIISLFGDFQYHFFILIIIPIIVILLKNIRKMDENLAFILIMSLMYLAVISIVPLMGPYQVLPMWISIAMLSSIFFVKTLPKIVKKLFKNFKNEHSKYVVIISISLVLFFQIGFSYKLLDTVLYDWDRVFETDIQKINTQRIVDELGTILESESKRYPSGYVYFEIGTFLSQQPDIENSYVMAKFPAYAYYAGSKYAHTHLQEGMKGDSLMNFVTRENWSDYDKSISNIFSHPNNRFDTISQIPDYLIYEEQLHKQRLRGNSTQFEDLKILLDPENENIPPNFEFIYKSNNTNTVVYKINPVK